MSIQKKQTERTVHDGIVNRHPVLILTGLMLFTGLIVYRKFLFGSFVYAFYGSGSDAIQQYIPSMLTVLFKLRNGDLSFWENNMGFGADILINQSHIMDPFNLPFYILGLLGLERAMYASLAVMQVLKCCMTGWFTYLFLDCFSFRKYAKILASYCCAFCGFIMLWGTHYFFATACVWMMLIIWLLEKSLRNPGFRIFLTLAVAAELTASLYLGFMIALMCALYLVVRLFLMREQLGPAGILRTLFSVGMCVVTAALMAGFILMPVYYQLTEVSTRLSGTSSILDKLRQTGFFYSLQMYHGLVLRFLSNNFQGTESFYQGPVTYIENIQLYFSLLLFPAAQLFFAEGIGYSKKKKTYAAGALLLGVLVFLPVTAYIFNRGVNSATRFAFVFIPAAAWIIAFVLSHAGEFHRGSLLLTWICTTCCFVYLYLHRPILDQYHLYRHFVLTMAGALCFLLIVTILSLKGRKLPVGKYPSEVHPGWLYPVSILLTALLTVGNVTAESVITVDAMSSAAMEDMLTLNGRKRWTQAGLDYISMTDGQQVNRTEKTFSDKMIWCEPQTEDYQGCSYYNTTYNKHVVQFIYKVWPDIMYLPQLGHHYVVFRNDYSNSRMAALMNIRYILSTAGPSIGVEEYELVSDTGVYVYENRLAGGLGILFDSLLTEEDLESAEVQERQAHLGDHLVLEHIPDGMQELHTDVPEGEAPADYCRTHGVVFEKAGDDGHIQADLETDHEQMLFVSIPFDKGWMAEVNGEPAEIVRADYGFQAVRVPAGASHVTFTYHSPGLKTGVILSAAGWVLFLAECIFRRKRRR